MNRRNFMSKAPTMLAASGLLGTNVANCSPVQGSSVYLIGPMPGYSPHVGALVSMLNYNRETVLRQVRGMSMDELDHLHDSKANSIGALLLHLGATEKFYQANTFENRELNAGERKIWGAASALGDRGRSEIKGNTLNYYLDMITEVREKTLEEFKKRDDEWLMTVDEGWSSRGALNTYWKWFHVCEHEANHRGQITWLKKRLPS